jgi:hypothetical protein
LHPLIQIHGCVKCKCWLLLCDCSYHKACCISTCLFRWLLQLVSVTPFSWYIIPVIFYGFGNLLSPLDIKHTAACNKLIYVLNWIVVIL